MPATGHKLPLQRTVHFARKRTSPPPTLSYGASMDRRSEPTSGTTKQQALTKAGLFLARIGLLLAMRETESGEARAEERERSEFGDTGGFCSSNCEGVEVLETIRPLFLPYGD